MSKEVEKKEVKKDSEHHLTKEEYDNPVDHGWAWMILISTFVICMLNIGGIKSFGVLLVELSREYDLPKSLLSFVQSLTGFFFLALGPISNAFSVKYSFQKMTIIGGICTSLGLILTSFATSIEVIFFTYGVLTGAGFGLSFSPSMVFLAHHFDKRRALANGIALSGSGFGSMVLPYLMQYLINTYTLQGCMLILSAVMAHIIVCGALFRPLYKYPSKIKDFQIKEDLKVMNPESEKLLPSSEVTNEAGNKQVTESVEKELISGTLPNASKDTCISDSCSQGNVNEPPKVESPVSRFLSQESMEWKGSQKHLGSMNTALCASLGALSSVSCQNIPNSIDPLKPLDSLDVEIEYENVNLNAKEPICENKCLQKWFLGMMDWSLFKSALFLAFFIFVFLINVCYHSIFNCLPSYAQENGLKDTEGALLLAIFGAAELAGRIFIGWFSDIFVRQRCYVFGIGSIISGAGVFLLPQFTTFFGLSLWLSSFGLITGFYNGLLLTVIVDSFGLERLSSAWGFACFSASFSLFANPILFGFLKDQSGTWSLAFRVGGAAGVLAGAVYFVGLCIDKVKHGKKITRESK